MAKVEEKTLTTSALSENLRATGSAVAIQQAAPEEKQLTFTLMPKIEGVLVGDPSGFGIQYTRPATPQEMEQFKQRYLAGENIYSSAEERAITGLGIATLPVPILTAPNIARAAAFGVGAVAPVAAGEAVKVVTTGQHLTPIEAVGLAGMGELAVGVGIGALAGSKVGTTFQGKLNTEYQNAVELGKPYAPSLAERLFSDVTGIRAQEPAQGIVGLPSIETADATTKYMEYSGTKTIDAASFKEGGLVKGTMEVPTTFKVEMGDLYQNPPPAKLAGMDIFDLTDAPNTVGFGQSFKPIEPTTPSARGPVYWFNGKILIPTSALNTPPTDKLVFSKSADIRESEQAALAEGPKPVDLGSFNKYPYNLGRNLDLSFQKENLPTMEELVPKEQAPTTAGLKVSNSEFYKNTPWDFGNAVQVGKPPISGGAILEAPTKIETAGKGGTVARVLEVAKADPITALYPWQGYAPPTKGAQLEEQTYELNYPNSGLKQPPKLSETVISDLGSVGAQKASSPSSVLRIGGVGTMGGGLLIMKGAPVLGSDSTPILVAGQVTPNKGLTKNPLVWLDTVTIGKTSDLSRIGFSPITSPISIQKDTTITKTVPIQTTTPILDIPQITKTTGVPEFSAPKNGFSGYIPSLGSDFPSLGGTSRRSRPRGGVGRYPRVYPIVTGEQMLKNLLSKPSHKTKIGKRAKK